MKRNVVCIILMTLCLSTYAEDAHVLNGVWRDQYFYDALTNNPQSSIDYEGGDMKRANSMIKIKIRSDGTGSYWSVNSFGIDRIEKQGNNEFTLYLDAFITDEMGIGKIDIIGQTFITLTEEDSIFVAQSERLSLYEGNFVRVSGPAKIPLQYGVMNDTRVRLRSKPNLESDTWLFLNTGDEVTIIDKSAEKQQIGDMKDYWYKVQTELFPDGWVYGAFIDIEN